ncbi:hypothetical protein BDF22DRAFT_691381 [Syncephalis plumigaleata]|nr:hypothetical protein BDF22DRAFT_691381 [Syncephalis plumigaleata]
MGCTQSTPADDDATRNLMNNGGANPSSNQRRGRNSRGGLTLLPDRPEWTSPEPITQAELDSQRTAFWETAPTYEGRLEVWQALQLVCQPDTDLATAQVVLDSVGVTLPTGLLADGAFDTLGNRYSIPNYCLSAPTNLIGSVREDGERAVVIATLHGSAEATKQANDTATEDAGEPIKLRIRLTTNEDVALDMHANDQLYPQVTRALLEAHPPKGHDKLDDKETQVQVRYMRLGRVLRGEQRLAEFIQSGESSLLLQAMINVIPSVE